MPLKHKQIDKRGGGREEEGQFAASVKSEDKWDERAKHATSYTDRSRPSNLPLKLVTFVLRTVFCY